MHDEATGTARRDAAPRRAWRTPELKTSEAAVGVGINPDPTESALFNTGPS